MNSFEKTHIKTKYNDDNSTYYKVFIIMMDCTVLFLFINVIYMASIKKKACHVLRAHDRLNNWKMSPWQVSQSSLLEFYRFQNGTGTSFF